MGNRLGFDQCEQVCNLECDGTHAQNLLTVISATLFPEGVTWERMPSRCVHGVCTIGCTAIGNVSTCLLIRMGVPV